MTAQQVQQDETAATAADAVFQNDKEDLQSILAKYREPFQKSQGWIDAQANLKQARADLQTAKQAVLANLSNDADYSAAVTDKQKADADLFQAKASGETSPDDLGPLAYAAMDASAKLGKIEDAAQAADPGVTAASQKVEDARTALDQLNVQFQQTLQTKEDWTAANAKFEASGKTLSDARAKLAADVQLLPAGAVPPPAVPEPPATQPQP
jgi:DNA repair ATPase RecN